MRELIRISALAAALGLAACGSSSPASPSNGTGSGPSSAGTYQTTGRVVDALSGIGIGGIMASSNERTLTTLASDTSGAFTIAVDASGTSTITFDGPGIVTRQTVVKVPGDAVTITAIPSSFDLVAFNELCRSSLANGSAMLMRWTTAPPLEIRTQTMQYTNINNAQFTTLADTMSTSEYDGLLGDLSWALPRMTGNQFSSFAGTSRQDNAADASVTMLVSGQITVGRFVGLTAATGYWGYTRWQFRSDGVVTAGAIMLDRDFDRSGSAFVRSLRTHELGHALGYNHVTVRSSVMNAQARFEPNDFDLAATRVVFLRPPGNRTPDIDPSGFSTNRLRLTWTQAIH